MEYSNTTHCFSAFWYIGGIKNQPPLPYFLYSYKLLIPHTNLKIPRPKSKKSPSPHSPIPTAISRYDSSPLPYRQIYRKIPLFTPKSPITAQQKSTTLHSNPPPDTNTTPINPIKTNQLCTMHKNIAFHFVYIALLFICQVIKLRTKAVKKSFFRLNTNFRLSTISRRIKNRSCDQDRSCDSKNFRSDKSIYREQYNVTVNISPKEVQHVHEILCKISISSRVFI